MLRQYAMPFGIQFLKLIGLLVLETVLQSAATAVQIKLSPYMTSTTLRENFVDSLRIIGPIKLYVFLPVYAIYYFFIKKNTQATHKEALAHALLFLLIYIALGLALPQFFFYSPLMIPIYAALSYAAYWLAQGLYRGKAIKPSFQTG